MLSVFHPHFHLGVCIQNESELEHLCEEFDCYILNKTVYDRDRTPRSIQLDHIDAPHPELSTEYATQNAFSGRGLYYLTENIKTNPWLKVISINICWTPTNPPIEALVHFLNRMNEYNVRFALDNISILMDDDEPNPDDALSNRLREIFQVALDHESQIERITLGSLCDDTHWFREYGIKNACTSLFKTVGAPKPELLKCLRDVKHQNE